MKTILREFSLIACLALFTLTGDVFALPHRHSLPEGNTQNIYGLKLRRNDFGQSRMYGAPGHGLRNNYFGPELEPSKQSGRSDSKVGPQYSYSIPRDAPPNWGFTRREYGNGQIWQEYEGGPAYNPNLIPPIGSNLN